MTQSLNFLTDFMTGCDSEIGKVIFFFCKLFLVVCYLISKILIPLTLLTSADGLHQAWHRGLEEGEEPGEDVQDGGQEAAGGAGQL